MLALMTRPVLSTQNNGVVVGTGDSVGADAAVASLERDAIAAGVYDGAIDDTNAFGGREMHQSTILWQRLAAAFDREPGQRDAVAALGGQQRRSVRQDQARGAAHAEELRAGCQIEVAGAVDTRRQDQRRARAGSLVEGALKCAALVVGRARAHAELWRVNAIG